MTHNLHAKTRFVQLIVALGATCSVIAVTTVAATPAQAIIVFDPSNYSQNILTAAHTLEQINNQTLTAADLLKPGHLAGTGFAAAWPLLDQASQLMGFTSFFDNFLTIAVLLFAWVLVIVAFFVLAVQLFVTILEFKLTTLAGFTAMGSAASTSYQLGQEAAGSSSVGAGLGGVAQAAGNAARTGASNALGLSGAAASGREAAWDALKGSSTAGRPSSPDAQGAAGGAPGWARDLKTQQSARHHRHVAMQTLKEGDRGGASATPDIKERED